MACKTSSFGLFSQKRMKRESYSSTKERKKSERSVSLLMCGTSQIVPTLAFQKWGTEIDMKPPTVDYGAKQEQIFQNHKTESSLIHMGNFKEELRESQNPREFCKSPKKKLSLPQNISCTQPIQSLQIFREPPTSGLRLASKYTHRPRSLAVSKGNCTSVALRSGKTIIKRLLSACTEQDVFPEDKRRKIDDQRWTKSMWTDRDFWFIPSLPPDVNDTYDVQQTRQRTIRSSLLMERSPNDRGGLNLLSEHQNMQEACDTFILILDKHLRVKFVSENVSKHLGHQQVEMHEQSIGHFLHPKDTAQVIHFTKCCDLPSEAKDNDPLRRTRRMFHVAMRFSFQRSGTCIQETGYTQVLWAVNVRLKKKERDFRVNDLLVLCRPVRHDSVLDMLPLRHAAIIYHGLGFQFIFCDPKLFHLMGYVLSDINVLAVYNIGSAKNFLPCSRLLDVNIIFKSGCCRYWSGVLKWLNTKASIMYKTKQKPSLNACKHHSARNRNAEKTMEMKDFSGINCFVISQQALLPLESIQDFDYQVKDNKNMPDGIVCCFSDHFLSLPNHKSQSTSKQQKDIHVLCCGICGNLPKHCTITVPESSKSIHDEHRARTVTADGAKPTIQLPNIVYNGANFCNAALNRHQKDIGNCLLNLNFQSKSTLNMPFKRNTLTQEVNSGQEHQPELVLPAQRITNTNSLVSDISSTLNEYMLVDILEKHQTTKDELSFCDIISDDSEFEEESSKFSEQRTQCDQARQFLKAQSIQKSDQSVISTKKLRSSNQPIASSFSSTHGNLSQSSCYKFRDNIKAKCHLKEYASDISSNIFSSKVASILQRRSTSPSQDSKNINQFLNYGFITNNDDTASFCDTFTYTDGIIHSSEQDSILCDKKLSSIEISHFSSPVKEAHCDVQAQKSKFIVHLEKPQSSSSSCISQTPAVNYFIKSSTDKTALNRHSQTGPFSASTKCLEPDYYIPTSNKCSQKNTKIENANGSLFTEFMLPQTENTCESYIKSKMTDKMSDPFLYQVSFSEPNNLQGTDVFDNETSVTSSLTSSLLPFVCTQNATTSNKTKYLHLQDQPVSNANQNFIDTTILSTFSSEGLNELESFLNTIPSSPCPTSSLPNVNHTEPISYSEWAEPQHFSSSGPNDSLDGETSRPSLLRTLLDKEGSVIQGPQTYTDWVLEQNVNKNFSTKNGKIHNAAANLRETVSSEKRSKKSRIRKSVELPKVNLTQRHTAKLGRSGLPAQKKTKELPLPSSVKAVANSQSSIHSQPSNLTDEFIQQKYTLNQEVRNNDYVNSQEIGDSILPDDLLDMAVDYCAPLEIDQAEALLFDLNDNCTWEDNLYSLLESSVQEKLKNTHSQSTQKQSEQSQTGTEMSASSFINLSQFHEIPSTPPSPSLPAEPNLPCSKQYTDKLMDNDTISHMQSSLIQKPIPCQTVHEFPLSDTSNASSFDPTVSVNRKRKMSLLRAAITSPDVDKLIEQIPFQNSRKVISPLSVTSGHENDSDTAITKVIRLQKSPNLPLLHISHDRLNKVASVSQVNSPESISTSKIYGHNKNFATSHHSRDEDPSQHICTNRMQTKYLKNQQPLKNKTSNHSSTSERQSSANSLVIKIKTGSNSLSHKIISVKHGTQYSIVKTSQPVSTQISSSETNSTISRRTEISKPDLSSTQPVSVMIMRKENHRSRRYKSIAIQTDNVPGEVYPELEHSPSDIIQYPSVMISSLTVKSPCPDKSPSSTSLSSNSSMCELEKLLLCHSGSEDSSSSADDDYRLISSTPFLFKILTGELSKDCYQRLDKQLLEKEKHNKQLMSYL